MTRYASFGNVTVSLDIIRIMYILLSLMFVDGGPHPVFDFEQVQIRQDPILGKCSLEVCTLFYWFDARRQHLTVLQGQSQTWRHKSCAPAVIRSWAGRSVKPDYDYGLVIRCI